LTALDRASCSSSSSTSVVSSTRDFRPTLRQIFFARPSSVFLVSCLRSQPRGILTTGSEPGSRAAVSVSFHVWSNGARGARLRGEGTMLCDRRLRMLRDMRYYTGANIRTGGRRGIPSVVGCACRARWQAAATTTNTRDKGALGRSRLFRPLETFGPHRHSRPQDDPEAIVAARYPPLEPPIPFSDIKMVPKPQGSAVQSVTHRPLPPLPKLRVRRPNKPEANPCLGIMSSVLGT
jgi:hypothetical protein